MDALPPRRLWSLGRTVLFWWLLLLLLQQAQRVSLLLGAAAQERPPARVLLATVLTGLRADLVTAGFGIATALLIAVVMGSLIVVARRAARGGGDGDGARVYVRVLTATSALVAVLYLVILTLDFGYYQYAQQRLDFVFFEYLGDLLGAVGAGAALETQAGRQTTAEAQDLGRWLLPISGYVALEAVAITGWWFCFTRWIGWAMASWQAAAPRLAAGALALAVAAGGWGLHPDGPDSVQSASLSSSTYYALAQNPVWYIGTAAKRRVTMPAGVSPSVLAAMPEARAMRMAQAVLAPGATLPDPSYPLIRLREDPGDGLARRPNVLLLFVEALDRRFLKRTEGGVRVTPFLDRLIGDSVDFEHSFSNGAQTFHGLFATLCSSLPRHGIAATKARYANDYLCLPSLLQRAGYRTEMVIGQNRDRNHSNLGLFLARNGIDELIDETAYPPDAPRMGLGLTDGALFDGMLTRIRGLRAANRLYFLAALTTSTHHPFAVPDAHPDVTALRTHPDRYLPALRYVDFELERFFSALQREALLRDTVVFILGDHGRHETAGGTRLNRAAGHFTSALAVWVDPSLRSASTYRPRLVPGLVSHVDLAPTILGLAGLVPRLSSFVGRDLSCALATDCLPPGRVVYLSNVYDNLVGVADRDGFWFYGLDSSMLAHTDLDLGRPWVERPASDPAVAERVERILALYVASNVLIERNRLWSWREFGPRL